MNTKYNNDLNTKLVNDLLNTNKKYDGLRKLRLGEATERSIQNYRDVLKYLLAYEIMERTLAIMGVGNNWQIDIAFEDINIIPEDFLEKIGNCICEEIDTNPDNFGELSDDAIYRLSEDECIDFVLEMELLIAKKFGTEFETIVKLVKNIKLPCDAEEMELRTIEEHFEDSIERHYLLMFDNEQVSLRNISYFMNISTPPNLLRISDESDLFNCLMSIICLTKYGKLKKLICDKESIKLAQEYDFGKYVKIVLK